MTLFEILFDLFGKETVETVFIITIAALIIILICSMMCLFYLIKRIWTDLVNFIWCLLLPIRAIFCPVGYAYKKLINK